MSRKGNVTCGRDELNSNQLRDISELLPRGERREIRRAQAVAISGRVGRPGCSVLARVPRAEGQDAIAIAVVSSSDSEANVMPDARWVQLHTNHTYPQASM